eukprot:12226897-Ditylum_brightwellii.AAC.1
MGDLFSDLEHVRAYIDDLLVITKGNWEDHFAKLDEVLTSREGIQQLKKKVDAILKIAERTTKKQLHRFIGIINYYRDMWKGRAGLLAPMSKLTSNTDKWEWKYVHRTLFCKIKELLSKE